MTTPTSSASTPTGSEVTGPGGTGSALDTAQGKTTISDAVVSKVAGIAAREIPGVYGFGGGAARALGAIAERIPGGRASTTQGVSVEVGERQAAVDLTIVVEYGMGVAELARAIRRNVIAAVEQMTGLEVVEVNINVVDLHVSGDDDGDDQPRDVQPPRTPNRVQ